MPQGGLMVTVPRLAGVVSAGFVTALLVSQPVTHAQTAAATATALQPTTPSSPTFTKDVLPILQRSCQSCHRPGTPAPMSLLTYAEVRPWARSIKSKVTNRAMPPWHIDRSFSEYANAPSLGDPGVATSFACGERSAPQG